MIIGPLAYTYYQSQPPGDIELDAFAGTVQVAAGHNTITVTNILIDPATTNIFVVLREVDATFTKILRVVQSTGSFVITGNAPATGNVTIGFATQISPYQISIPVF